MITNFKKIKWTILVVTIIFSCLSLEYSLANTEVIYHKIDKELIKRYESDENKLQVAIEFNEMILASSYENIYG